MEHQINKKIIVTVGTLVLLTVTLAGCHETDRAEGQLVLGSITPQTGALSQYGPSARNAVDLAVMHVNAAGGVNGEDVLHTAEDSETSETASTSAVSNLIQSEGIHALVGPMGSGMTNAIISQVMEAQIPMISPSNTGPEFSTLDHGGWYFRTVPSDALQGAVMAGLVAEHNHTDVSILAANDPYGTGFGDVFEQEFAAAGGNVLAYERYDREGQDFSSDVEAVAGDSPDAIVLIGYPDEGDRILRSAFEAGYVGEDSDIQWYFSEGFNSQTFVDNVHNEQEGILNDYWGTTPEQNTNATFLGDFEAEFGEEPALFADRTYDAAVLLMLAAEHCGCTDGEGIRDSVRSVQNSPGEEVVYDAGRALELIRNGQDIIWTGAAGPLEFDDQGDVTAPYATWQIVDGEIAVQDTGIVP